MCIRDRDKAKEIRHLQDTVLPKLKQQLAETKGIFKGKERKDVYKRQGVHVVCKYSISSNLNVWRSSTWI